MGPNCETELVVEDEIREMKERERRTGEDWQFNNLDHFDLKKESALNNNSSHFSIIDGVIYHLKTLKIRCKVCQME